MWCVCVAVLSSEFREQPRSAEVAVGTDVLLGCRAPRGEPEPRIRWQKDGDPVRPDDRVTVSETGTLRIRDSSKDDSGVYVCIAYNIGGEKESSSARLTVRGPLLSAAVFALNLITCYLTPWNSVTRISHKVHDVI